MDSYTSKAITKSYVSEFCVDAIKKILIDKGVATEDEFREALMHILNNSDDTDDEILQIVKSELRNTQIESK